MGRLFKIIFSIIASVILLIIIAAVAIPFFIDPNDFKPEIQTAVKDNIGRELAIEGDLELSIFPWIGLSTGKLTIGNAKGFSEKPFAEIEESNVKVKLLPLLLKEVEVSRIVLKGLVLNLAKNKQGISNWDDLTRSNLPVTDDSTTKNVDKQSENRKQENTDTPAIISLAIGGISIEQAKIAWDDRQQDKHVEINNFNLTTDELLFGRSVAIDLSLTAVTHEPAITESINFSTDLTVNEQLDDFKFNKINITSVTRGEKIPGEKLTVNLFTELSVNTTLQTLNISGLKLNTGNLSLTADINGSKILDKPVFKGPISIAEFNPVQLMANMAMPLPEMQDPNALNKLSLALMLEATPDSVDIQNLSIKLDETNITGSGSIKNFNKLETVFDIKIDAIDVGRYMAPVKKNESPKIVATPASAATAVATLFPVETLRALNANGKINIDTLKINKLKMREVGFKLKAKNGVIGTQQTVKQLYQGSYTGSSSVNVQNKTPVLTLNEKLSKVQIEPLLKDLLGKAKITGVANATVKIKGRGNTAPALKSSLNGNLDFNFKDGVIKGINLQKLIDNGKALMRGTSLPKENKNDQTVFSVIRGTAKINNGLVSNKDLYAEASKLRVNGEGYANLASEKLDYKVTVKLLKKVATETEAEKIKGIPVAIKIGGTFEKPSYSLEFMAMLSEIYKEKVHKKRGELLKKLDEKIDSGVGDLLKGLF